MRYVLTADAVRRAEERTAAEKGTPLSRLMDAAGSAVAQHVSDLVPQGRVVVLVGRGSNAGDGWVAAELLHTVGRDVHVISPVMPGELSGDAAVAAAKALGAGVSWHAVPEGSIGTLLGDAACVVDAMLGIGASGALRAPFDVWVREANSSGAIRIAVDVPTGVATDTGEVVSVAFDAHVTVTFSALKPGLVLYPGARFAGDVSVVDVGIPPEYLTAVGEPEIWAAEDYAPLVPLPDPEAHKNSRGRLLVVAGSGAYPGAAALAAWGAQRCGAGYVTVAVPESVVPFLHAKLTSAVVVGMPENPGKTFASRAAEMIRDLAREHDAVVLGPGMTLAHGSVLVARSVVMGVERPLVIDADGLNALIDEVDIINARTAPTVLTPHPGELARLIRRSVVDVQADRVGSARGLSTGNVACLLKGPHSIIAGDGRTVVNVSGGPALATAGTGDLLSGMIGALLAQRRSALEAAALGAYLHGRAADVAAARLTPVSVTAEDVAECIPDALSELLTDW